MNKRLLCKFAKLKVSGKIDIDSFGYGRMSHEFSHSRRSTDFILANNAISITARASSSSLLFKLFIKNTCTVELQ